MPGDSGEYEWTGYIPFDELPQALDPPGGIIATANARVAGPGYEHYVTSNWSPPWRVDRIYQLLGQPEKIPAGGFRGNPDGHRQRAEPNRRRGAHEGGADVEAP